ncbi:MAG: amidohydrolase [Planctomycetaceae bacterium]|nr:amidohydrolase [Planctomycetaceae bacterium]
MPALTRRSCLMGIATSGMTLGSSTSAGHREVKPSQIVDAHVHVWSTNTTQFPLAPGFSKSDLWFPSYPVEEVRRLGAAAGVNRFNLVQMTWYGLDHSYILDAIARDPQHFVGTGIVPAVADVALADPGRTMLELAQGGIYAFRIRGHSTRPKIGAGPRWMDYPGFEKMFATGAQHNLALSFLLGPKDLPEVDRMCKRFPQTPVILDHFCLIGRQKTLVDKEIQALCNMAQHRRVMVKLGAFYGLGAQQPPYLDMVPLIQRIVDAFGPDRCMWESDAPLQTRDGHTFAAAVAVIGEHCPFLSETDKHKILTTTAENFFFRRL